MKIKKILHTLDELLFDRKYMCGWITGVLTIMILYSFIVKKILFYYLYLIPIYLILIYVTHYMLIFRWNIKKKSKLRRITEKIIKLTKSVKKIKR